MRHLRLLALMPFVCALGPKADTHQEEKNLPLTQAKFADILKRYTFIGDVSQKPAEREISPEYFWRYPFILPDAEIPIDYTLGDADAEMPATEGNDRATQHLNRGRMEYRKKNYEEARKVWLAARAYFGTNFEHHRRNDYFIAAAFLKISREIEGMFPEPTTHSEVRLTYSNTATFLSWAFIKKKDNADPLMDKMAPKGLYDLAAIYFLFDRYTGAHAAAEEGLNFLRRTGRSDYRSKLRRIIAETWIRDHSYLNAMQELDNLIRQDQDPKESASAFARVGDIYFDLNNYDLAEDAYAISQNIDDQIHQAVPLSAILRGESLFWLGKFSEAQKMLQFGIESVNSRQSIKALSMPFQAWGRLRIADAYLARYHASKEKKDPSLLEKAELAYYQVEREYPKAEAAKIAKIRRGCLALPQYTGKNVAHAREMLAGARKDDLPLQAIELAWGCEVLSYGQRERDEKFIGFVKEFYAKFPKSRFIADYIPLVQQQRASYLDDYFQKNDPYRAILFYEANAATLFTKPTETQKQNLFAAYVDTFTSPKAVPFWPAFQPKINESADQLMRAFMFLSEVHAVDQKEAWLSEERKLLASERFGKFTLNYSPAHLTSMQRILSTPSGRLHLPWMAKAVYDWSGGDERLTCNVAYPFLSQWAANLGGGGADLLKLTNTLVQKWLPLLFDKDQNCAISLLDLELRVADEIEVKPSYAKLWLNRLNWPPNALVMPLIEGAAEILYLNNERDQAETLWTYLARQDSSLYPEARFAKLRLDKNRTETEQLWK